MKSIIFKKIGILIKSVVYQFRGLFYIGRKYRCIICHGNFRKFLPTGQNNKIAKTLIGAGSRNVKCPKCASTDRERLIYFYLKNKTDICSTLSDIKILHIAPERNLRKLFTSKKNAKYVAGDINPQIGDAKLDITNLDMFEDGYFDVVICSHVLEHIPNDKKAMKELYRVLSSGGIAILQVPISKKLQKTYEDVAINSPEHREQAFGQKDHVRIYGKDYSKRLEASGFHIEMYEIINNLDRSRINKYGLNSKETLYIGHK